MKREAVEPWASAMVAVGLVDGREGVRKEQPSMRKLADKAETTTSTIVAMMYGTRDTSNEVIERVAEALGMADQVGIVMGWVARERTKIRPFEPHPDANLLTTDEQEAVNEVIRLLALSKKRGGGEHDRSAATSAPPDEGGGSVVQMPTRPTAPSPRGQRRPAARKTAKPTAKERGEDPDKSPLD